MQNKKDPKGYISNGKTGSKYKLYSLDFGSFGGD